MQDWNAPITGSKTAVAISRQQRRRTEIFQGLVSTGTTLTQFVVLLVLCGIRYHENKSDGLQHVLFELSLSIEDKQASAEK